jgi:spore photoproduct lyase
MDFTFEKIYIDRRAVSEDLTKKILDAFPSTPRENIRDDDLPALIEPLALNQGKRILYLTLQKGGLVKSCPATSSPYLCCRYTIVNQFTQCPMDCTYCILQHYLDDPVLTFNVNIRDIFNEIERIQVNEPKRFFRFGTGELADSLALDPYTGLSVQYADFFSTRRNALIELKTKTDSVAHLLTAPRRNVVVSWSMNPKTIIGKEEFKTASVQQRLEAAGQCQDKGFLLGFHFDPIVLVPDWDKSYQDLVDGIFNTVDGSRIVWISLGALRFPPPLKDIIQNRFPKSRIAYQEMVRGIDGKMRYPRPLRVEMFQKIYDRIREHSEDVFVYFCMEPPWVWDAVMGEHPETNADLDFRFAWSLNQRFPELEMDEPVRESYRDKPPCEKGLSL